jgi:sugar lactone lactonase YvrE
MLKIDPKGVVAPFATVSEKGLGHLCFKDDRFYVTASQSHAIYEVTLDGTAKRILGNGERGIVDGAGANARLSFPNGIAYSLYGPRLYINEFVNESPSALPRRAIVREIDLQEKNKGH